jgi:hypothetical protein
LSTYQNSFFAEDFIFVKILFRSEGKSAKVKEKVHWEFSNVTDKKK